MTLVAGLGNPGEKYKNNRHNAGFIVINELALKWGLTWKFNKKFNAEVATVIARPKVVAISLRLLRFARNNERGRNDNVILIKPQTYMNESGEAVSKVLNYFGVQPADLLVIHDDVDLEALQFKTSRNSSSAGHRGVQNIIDRIGTQDFTRLRVGIGRPPQRFEEWEVKPGSRYENVVVDATKYMPVEKYVLQDFPSDQLELVKKQGIEHLLSSLNL